MDSTYTEYSYKFKNTVSHFKGLQRILNIVGDIILFIPFPCFYKLFI